MKKIATTFFLLFCIIPFLSAQKEEKKIIKFSDLTSHSVILHSSLEKLIYFLGTPDDVSVNHRAYCFKNGKEKDISYFYSRLEYKNRHLLYGEHNDTVRIECIYFDKKTNYLIFHPLATFSNCLKMSSFTREFNIPKEKIGTVIGRLVAFKSKPNTAYYEINFENNENDCEEIITFYFNRQGYLKAITFSIY